MTRRGPGRPSTGRSLQVLGFMVEFHKKNDQLPSARAIANHFGWASTNAAYSHMERLAKAGHIEKNDAGKYRFSRSKNVS
jgi:SOS-response transcriptional repressor LexA